MTEQTKPDLTARNMAVRTQALDMAIRANCGIWYTEDNMSYTDHEKILTAAREFENFINGTKETENVKW